MTFRKLIYLTAVAGCIISASMHMAMHDKNRVDAFVSRALGSGWPLCTSWSENRHHEVLGGRRCRTAGSTNGWGTAVDEMAVEQRPVARLSAGSRIKTSEMDAGAKVYDLPVGLVQGGLSVPLNSGLR